MTLKTIADEAADCRAAWAAHPEAKWGIHIHHGDAVIERLTQPIQDRIDFILNFKAEAEKPLRLRLLRPILCEVPSKPDASRVEFEAAEAEWAEINHFHTETQAWVDGWKVWYVAYMKWNTVVKEWAETHHAEFCQADCPWDGKTIFPTA